MKIKTNLLELQKHKLINNLQAKERLIDADISNYITVLNDEPQLLIAEQKLYRAIDPYQAKKAFDDTFAQRALNLSRAKYGKISVTKVVQDFFASTSSIIMRMMQDIKIDISEETIIKYLRSVHRKMLRQEIPQKIMKKLS